MCSGPEREEERSRAYVSVVHVVAIGVLSHWHVRFDNWREKQLKNDGNVNKRLTNAALCLFEEVKLFEYC